MREMRWSCEESGCYRRLMPKLGAFDPCFPRKIGMTDVDGMVEIGGRFLVLEWKSRPGALPKGQRLAFEAMTAGNADPMKFTVIVVTGDPQNMTVKTVQVFQRGKGGEVEACSFEQLFARIKGWRERAEEARARPSRRVAAE